MAAKGCRTHCKMCDVVFFLFLTANFGVYAASQAPQSGYRFNEHQASLGTNGTFRLHGNDAVVEAENAGSVVEGLLDVKAESADSTERRRQLSEGTDVSLCQLERLGGRPSDGYGAWTLCTDLLDASGGIVYSFGIGGDVSFDFAMVNRGSLVFGFDPTVTPEKVEKLFIDNHQRTEQPASFKFQQLGLGKSDGVVKFFRSKDPRIGSLSAVSIESLTHVYKEFGFHAAVLRLRTFMCMNEHAWLDVLKMDVEGVELDVCLSKEFVEKKIPAKQLLVEFHSRMIKDGYRLEEECVNNLKANGFTLVYVSPNKEEYTFARLN